MVVVFASLLVVFFERTSANSNIRTLGDALWWASETVSTVGYGDYYPVTTGGKIVAVALFVNGIALLSAVTATIAARVLENNDDEDDEPPVTLNDLNERLAAIEAAIAALSDTRSAFAADAGEDRPGSAG